MFSLIPFLDALTDSPIPMQVRDRIKPIFLSDALTHIKSSDNWSWFGESQSETVDFVRKGSCCKRRRLCRTAQTRGGPSEPGGTGARERTGTGLHPVVATASTAPLRSTWNSCSWWRPRLTAAPALPPRPSGDLPAIVLPVTATEDAIIPRRGYRPAGEAWGILRRIDQWLTPPHFWFCWNLAYRVPNPNSKIWKLKQLQNTFRLIVVSHVGILFIA